MKIGLIQSRGIGDIVIAVPIAKYYLDRGNQVFWPVDIRFYPFVQEAFPDIRFIAIDPGVTGEGTLDYWYNRPLLELNNHGCERIFCLYSYLSGLDIVNAKFANSLKFDEYKYATAEVPFAQKWKLRVTRNRAREQSLIEKLGISREFALVHEYGSNFRLDIRLPDDVVRDYQVIKISEVSDNPFDWLGVMERASMFVCVDSCFANLAEQLNLCSRKYLFLRSDMRFTPVFKNNWIFQ